MTFCYQDTALASDIVTASLIDPLLGFRARKYFPDESHQIEVQPSIMKDITNGKVKEYELESIFGGTSHKLAKLYVETLKCESGVEFQKTTRYRLEKNHGLKVIATKPWPPKTDIKVLSGLLAPIAKTDVIDGVNDFSMFQFPSSSKILVGPVSHVNHDCSPNAAYVSCEGNTSKMHLRTLRPIAVGEEITALYNAHYFDNCNESCECLTCENLLQGIFELRLSLEAVMSSYWVYKDTARCLSEVGAVRVRISNLPTWEMDNEKCTKYKIKRIRSLQLTKHEHVGKTPIRNAIAIPSEPFNPLGDIYGVLPMLSNDFKPSYMKFSKGYIPIPNFSRYNRTLIVASGVLKLTVSTIIKSPCDIGLKPDPEACCVKYDALDLLAATGYRPVLSLHLCAGTAALIDSDVFISAEALEEGQLMYSEVAGHSWYLKGVSECSEEQFDARKLYYQFSKTVEPHTKLPAPVLAPILKSRGSDKVETTPKPKFSIDTDITTSDDSEDDQTNVDDTVAVAELLAKERRLEDAKGEQSAIRKECKRRKSNKGADLPFKCEVCDEGFLEKRYVKAHFDRRHRVKPAKLCRECGKPFKDKLYRRRHYQDFHPDAVLVDSSTSDTEENVEPKKKRNKKI